MLGFEQWDGMDGVPQAARHQQSLRCWRLAQDPAAQLESEVMVVGGAGVLVLVEAVVQRHSPETPYRHVLFAAALAVSGVIVGYQIKRVRALSMYYEHRPLP